MEFSELKLVDNYNPSIMVCAVRIKLQSPFDIMAVYKPPNIRATYSDWINLFQQCNLNNCYILGDFNIHSTGWGCAYDANSSADFTNALDELHLAILNNGSSTHLSHPGRGYAIDLSLVSPNLVTKCMWEVGNDTLGSHHYPIFIQFTRKGRDIASIFPTSKWNIKDADWQYSAPLEEAFANVNTNVHARHLYDLILRSINTLGEKVFKVKKPRQSKRKEVCWWDYSCDSAIFNRKQTLQRPVISNEILFELLHNLTPNLVGHSVQDGVTQDVAHVLLEPFTDNDLDIVLNDSTNSAPGMDNILYPMIKHLPISGKKIMLDMFNKMYIDGEEVRELKSGIIAPIIKKGNQGCSFAHQYGFKRSHSTITALSNLVTDIQGSFSKDKYLMALFIDLKDAYNSVKLLIPKTNLMEVNIPATIATNIVNLYTNRSLVVKSHTNNLIGPRVTSAGLAQGAVLSPLLFNIYTSDLALPNVEIIQYADDIVVYTEQNSLDVCTIILNQAMSLFQEWCILKEFSIAPNKCNVVCFTRHRISDHIQLKLANDLFMVSNVVKYLGMWLDSKLTWRAHISETTKKCQKAMNVLRVISKISFGTDLHTSRLIYRATVNSLLDYGCFLYGSAYDLHMSKLKYYEIVQQFSQDTHIYTDGAKSKVGVGCAFIIPEMQYSERFRLPKEASVFTSEATTIRKAMEAILGMDRDNCAIFSDSQRVLKSFQNFNFSSSSLIGEMLLLDYSLRQRGKTVTYVWRKGHANIRFNEVDRLAKAACNNIDSVENFLLPHSDLLNEIKNRSYKDWQRHYTNVYKNNPTNYYMIFPEIKSEDVNYKIFKHMCNLRFII
ncbi:hypothetical protein Trydic_g20232 [Trypoxylus dichotomus]